ncbi:MAG: DUF1553 domain-containing protein [Planctomycetota bacterium]|nr:DUF1553 domain-containing protein [Planctomycetota bacterium]
MQRWLVIGPVLAVALLHQQSRAADNRVLFNRDIRPILAEHCWQCHGPDAGVRQAGLRLDVRAKAMQEADSGAFAIVPRFPRRSELLRRIQAKDPEERMPPAASHPPLSATQITLLRRWIEQGAEYQQHWAFQQIKRPAVPEIAGSDQPIDAFVAARLKAKGHSFAEEAAPQQLLRRLHLTLSGLPPAANHLIDQRPGDYGTNVDRLLASPHFGEHLAVGWLDAARYADTNGYFGDKPRQIWPWRDWVIDAFNRNMPFDQFTVEQLAGDLLPNATISQRVATGFNRNHMANNETGIIDEEYRVEYIVDRLDTTLTTWMGLTVGCSQCHDHKFDPISQRDFYRLFAFFNNGPEKGLISADNPPPLMTVASLEAKQRLTRLEAATAAARAQFAPVKTQLATQIAAWEADTQKLLPILPRTDVLLYEPFDGDDFASPSTLLGTGVTFERGVRGQAAHFDATQHLEHPLTRFNVDATWSIGFWIKPDGSLSCLLSKIEPEGRRRGLEILLQKGRVRVNLVQQWGARTIAIGTQEPLTSRQWHHVVVTYDGSRAAAGMRILIDGAPVDLTVQRDTLSRVVPGNPAPQSCANQEPLRIGRRDSGLGYYGVLDELHVIQRVIPLDLVSAWYRGERLRGILATDVSARNDIERAFLLDDYIGHNTNDKVKATRQRLRQAVEAERTFRSTIPTTLVMQDLPTPRTTRVLVRGQYDQPGETVQPGVPAALGQLSADAQQNRLGLARWMVSRNNPLTARVTVNRLWKHCFGHGLVRTMNDFGTQGEPPTHPQLLDWLAAELRDSGWDVKRLLRLIVTSRTFRQASHQQRDTSSDPNNRLLSRGPSYRMSAEMIRDHALAVSGLLRTRIGGPSVKPYQPPGLWKEVSYNATETYQADTGEGLWRRSLYTWIKRQAPPPSFLAFDGTTREKCTIQRAVTNTPLQSLILLNDPVFVEAARALASRVLTEPRTATGAVAKRSTGPITETEHRLNRLVQHVLSRHPDNQERRLLSGLLRRQEERFRQQPEVAQLLLSIGNTPLVDGLDPLELASWTVIAQAVLNLDEAITLR